MTSIAKRRAASLKAWRTRKRMTQARQDEMDDLKFQVSKLDLRAGDRVVITAKGQITIDMAERLKDTLVRFLAGTGATAAVFADGLAVSVQHPAAHEEWPDYMKRALPLPTLADA